MDSFLDKVFWGNTVQSYLVVLTILFIIWAIIRILRRTVVVRLSRFISQTNTTYDDILLSVIQKYITPYLILVINYQVIKELNLSLKVQGILSVAMTIITTYFFIRLTNHAIQLSINGFMRRRNESAARIRQVTGALSVVKALTWIFGFVALLGNLGFDVRTFIAGLGVGGIAIALAAQTVLGDIFSYFVIFFDKPFEIGDYVTTPTASGIIEHIGIKTTRLRSLDGEQLVMSNSDLTKSTIRNYRRLEKRRSVLTLQVVYSTNTEMLKQIPTIVKDVVSSHELATFERTHLSSLGSSSINFEVVYMVNSPELVKYMDTHHVILMKIIEAFQDRGIEFAYPTQRLYIDSVREETEQVGKTNDMNANSGSNDRNR